jgi:hypothetical protein
MHNLKLLLQREPAAIGTLLASIMPVLVLLELVALTEAQVAAVVVAVNTTIGFAVRLTVSPVPVARPRRRRSATQGVAS